MSPASRIWMVVIQGSPFCNIDCRYCYLPDRSSTRRIGLETVSRIGETVFTSGLTGSQLIFLWHAGEPMVLPPEFYAAAFDRLHNANRHGVALTHRMQTNGTLIDSRWCEFIRSAGIDLGVSIDGPAWLHDRNRVDRNGRGTFERVLRGIRLLRRHGLPVQLLVVLSPEAMDSPDEMWQFFVEEGVSSVGFNIEEIDGVHGSSPFLSSGSYQRCKRFFARLLELQEATEPHIFVREFDGLLLYLRYGIQYVPSPETVPPQMVNFDCEGRISMFSPELLGMRDAAGDFFFGDVASGGIESVWRNPRFQAVAAEIAGGVDLCRRTCAYFEVCGGGSPSNKLAENGTFRSAETMYCRLKFKAVTDSVREFLARQHVPALRG